MEHGTQTIKHETGNIKYGKSGTISAHSFFKMLPTRLNSPRQDNLVWLCLGEHAQC